MAKGHKPVKGSRAYWPKKRAGRIYPQLGPCPAGKGMQAFAGYKAGMAQAFFTDSRKDSATQGREITVPVTVLAVPDLAVFGIKAYKKTPYGLKESGSFLAEKLSKELSRKLSLPKNPRNRGLEGDEFRLLVHTRPAFKKRPEVFEIPAQGLEEAKALLGKDIKASEVFREGEYVDVRSVSKGKGYQGPVKRFGVVIRGRKAKKKRRHIGVLAPRNVARVRANTVAMAGQMGFQTRTEYNKLVLRIGEGGLRPEGGWVGSPDLKGSFLLLKGSVPGPSA